MLFEHYDNSSLILDFWNCIFQEYIPNNSIKNLNENKNFDLKKLISIMKC